MRGARGSEFGAGEAADATEMESFPEKTEKYEFEYNGGASVGRAFYYNMFSGSPVSVPDGSPSLLVGWNYGPWSAILAQTGSDWVNFSPSRISTLHWISRCF